MDVRSLTEADASAFLALRLRALREHPDAFGPAYEEERSTPVEAIAERLRRYSRTGEGFILGAWIDGTLAGILSFRRHEGVKRSRHLPPRMAGVAVGLCLVGLNLWGLAGMLLK